MNRRFAAYAVLFAFSTAAAFYMAGTAGAQVDPPTSGDWVVGDTTYVSAPAVPLEGNLTVVSGGTLTLIGVNLTFNSSAPGSTGLRVMAGGSLMISGGRVSAADANKTYRFEIYGAASIEGAVIERMWGSPTQDVFGVQIYSSGVHIKDSTIQDGTRGNVFIGGGSPFIEGTVIQRAHYAYGQSASMSGCSAWATYAATGILVANGSSPRLANNLIRENGGLEFADEWQTVTTSWWVPASCPSYFQIYEYFQGWGLSVLDASAEATGNTLSFNSAMPGPAQPCQVVGATSLCVIHVAQFPPIGVRYAAGAEFRGAGGNFTSNLITDNLLGGIAAGGGTMALHDNIIRNSTERFQYFHGGGLIITGDLRVNPNSFKNVTWPIIIPNDAVVRIEGITLPDPMGGSMAIWIPGAPMVKLDVWNVSFEGWVYGIGTDTDGPSVVHCYNCLGGPTSIFDSYYSRAHFELLFSVDIRAVWVNGAPVAGGSAVFSDQAGDAFATLRLDDQGQAPRLWAVNYAEDHSGSTGGGYYTGNDSISLLLVQNSFTGPPFAIYLYGPRNLTITYDDPYPPVLSVFAPVEGGYIGSKFVRVVGTAIDAGSGMASVSVSADGGTTWWDALASFPDWDVTLVLGEGVYDLLVVATDLSGTYTSAVLQAVTVDTTPPALAVFEPGAVALGGNLAYSNMTALRIRGASDYGAVVRLNGTVLPSDPTFSTQVVLAEGPNFFRLTSTDAAGNVATREFEIVLDTVRPSLILSSPSDGLVTGRATVLVAGRTESGVSLYVAGQPVPVVDGAFSFAYSLRLGTNQLWVNATDQAGNPSSLLLRVTYDLEPPNIVVDSPVDGAVLRDAVVSVTGHTDAAVTQVLVNGLAVATSAGVFAAVVPLEEGVNLIVVWARDDAGNEANRTITVTKDTTPPVIVVASPVQGLVLNRTSLNVSGTAEGAQTLTINGALLDMVDGAFNTSVALGEGLNDLVLVARDAAGNVGVAHFRVTRDAIPPEISLEAGPTFIGVSSYAFTLRGTAPGAARILVNGISVAIEANGSFAAVVPVTFGANNIVIRAVDAAGNEASTTLIVHRAQPEPAESAGIFGLGIASYVLLPACALAGAAGMVLWQRRRARG